MAASKSWSTPEVAHFFPENRHFLPSGGILRDAAILPTGAGQRAVLFDSSVAQVSQLSAGERIIVIDRNEGKWGIAMRVFIALAIVISAAIGLGGCFGHHEKAVVTEPLKLG
ncbi:MAG: hypothetical protein ACRECF_01275 [Methyloceanibacter sp.]